MSLALCAIVALGFTALARVTHSCEQRRAQLARAHEHNRRPR
jgi:hypothetical protein